MTCNKAQSLLSAYLDAEVTGVEMMLMKDHLRECECCRKEERALKEVKQILCRTPIEGPSADFEGRLLAAVAYERRYAGVSFFSRSAPRYAAICFSSFSVVMVLSVALSRLDKSGSPEKSAVARRNVAGVMPLKKNSNDVSFAIQRDRAFVSGSDPLYGPQAALSATYARP